jgi:hypothetical protein
MATLQQLELALANADKAGDMDAARKLAPIIKAERARNEPFKDIPGYSDIQSQVPGTEVKPPEPSIGEKVIGAGEAGLSAVTGATTGAIGMFGGFLKGLAGEMLSGRYGTEEGANNVGKAAEAGASALTYQPRTQAGQEYASNIGDVMQQAMPLVPAAAELGAVGEAVSAAKPVVRAAAREAAAPVATAATDLAAQVKAKIAGSPVDPTTGAPTVTAGTGQSVGAAAVDLATQRQAAADSLPVPIKLTEGMKTRDFSQQRFERETAKIPDIGEPIRQRMQDNNLKLQQNMDAFIDDTGAELTDARGVGEVVDKALKSRATRDKTKIRALYKEADNAGEMSAPVDLSPVLSLIKESESAKSLAPVLGATEQEMSRLQSITTQSPKYNPPSEKSFSTSLNELNTEGIVENSDFSRNLRGNRAMAWKLAEDMPRVNKLTKLLSSAKTTEPVELYRGLNDTNFINNNLKVGDVFTDNAFTSATTSMNSGFIKETLKDGGVVLKIRAPKGSPIAPIKTNTKYYNDELEALIQRGATFKIADISDLNPHTKLVTVDLLKVNPTKEAIANAAKSASTTEKNHLLNLAEGGTQHDFSQGLAPKQPGSLSLGDAEQLRKFVNKVAGADPTNVKYAVDIKRAIDTATEGKGGEMYKQARSARAQYAQDYENFGLAKQLLNTKRGSTDRAIAMEDVLHKSVISPSASVDTVSKLRNLLETEGETGKQAWKELQGGVLRHIRDEALKGVTRDAAGNQIVSAAALDRVVTQLDKTGKLDYVLGKKKAEQVRTINDVAKDVLTAPPGAVNTSNTATVLAGLLDLGLSGMTGIPAPVAIVTQQAISRIKNAKLRARVKQSLGE